ncbi:hypothetical protein ACH5RR_015910 [Cinchona calisaya]|uniref:Protein FAR1-RELATED SEQUENCE n=1 Tax=Cinchona calisaya TaxID=153742 RepID=A0ABD2ZWF0_9GENT
MDIVVDLHNEDGASVSAPLFSVHNKASARYGSIGRALNTDNNLFDARGMAMNSEKDLDFHEGLENIDLGNGNVDSLQAIRARRKKTRTAVSRQSGDEDAQAMLEYFFCMQDENPDFFYALDLNPEQLLGNVLWVDAKDRLDYESLSDVFLSFGCALIGDETKSTYGWLLRAWLRAMSGQAPKCAKIEEKLSNVIRQHESFVPKFDKCILKSVAEEQFGKRWWKLVESHISWISKDIVLPTRGAKLVFTHTTHTSGMMAGRHYTRGGAGGHGRGATHPGRVGHIRLDIPVVDDEVVHDSPPSGFTALLMQLLLCCWLLFERCRNGLRQFGECCSQDCCGIMVVVFSVILECFTAVCEQGAARKFGLSIAAVVFSGLLLIVLVADILFRHCSRGIAWSHFSYPDYCGIVTCTAHLILAIVDLVLEDGGREIPLHFLYFPFCLLCARLLVWVYVHVVRLDPDIVLFVIVMGLEIWTSV